jgi:hypothetical protein
MRGRTPTADEKRFMSAVAAIGCIPCEIDGNDNDMVSIHHIDGRTKPRAHYRILGLCAGHHQQGTGNDKTMIAVHPNKARFEAKYGTQQELLNETIARIEGTK